MLRRMKAIEYNWLLSMIDYIASDLPKYSADYGLSGIGVDILPAYPKDLTRLKKPSMIIQKVETFHQKVGMGNVLGSYTDTDNAIYDVYGMIHKIIAQIDIVASNRTQCTLLSSLVGENSLSTIHDEDSDKYIPLSDYVADINNPVEMGRIDVIGDVDVIDTTINEKDDSENGNDDYRVVLRFDCRIVQHIVDIDNSMVDLFKPIKWNAKLIQL